MKILYKSIHFPIALEEMNSHPAYESESRIPSLIQSSYPTSYTSPTILEDSRISPHLRAVPTGLISRRPTLIVGRLQSADSSGFKILNMFDRESRPTMRESVGESADSAVQWADYWSRPTGNWPSGYGPLVLQQAPCFCQLIQYSPRLGVTAGGAAWWIRGELTFKTER